MPDRFSEYITNNASNPNDTQHLRTDMQNIANDTGNTSDIMSLVDTYHIALIIAVSNTVHQRPRNNTIRLHTANPIGLAHIVAATNQRNKHTNNIVGSLFKCVYDNAFN